MDQSLNDLFSVIIHSEHAAFEEQRKYKEVKEKIEQTRLRLERQEEAKKELLDRVTHLKDGLVQAATGVKLLHCKENFFQDRLGAIQMEMQSDTHSLEVLRATQKKDCIPFLSLVKDFTADYGLTSSGRLRREAEANSHTKALVAEMDSHQQDVYELQQSHNILMLLSNKKDELAREKCCIIAERQNVEANINDEKLQITALYDEQRRLHAAPETDQEFLTLSCELGHLQDGKLEARARELHNELAQLTRQLRQQEGTKLRQQYRQWQRLRHHNQLQADTVTEQLKQQHEASLQNGKEQQQQQEL